MSMHVLSPVDAIKGMLQAAERNSDYRLTGCINLVASQNRISNTTLAFLSSSFAAKFASGELGSRAHGGAQWLDAMEEIVTSLAGRLFEPYFPEFRPMSGSIANETLLMGFAKPGDKIIAPSGIAGGHASVRPEGFAGFMGLTVLDLPFLDGGMTVDLDALQRLAALERPRLIILGTAKILFPYPVSDIVRIAESVGAQVVYDAAHVAGLIAGKQFQDPLRDGAIAFSGSTQKTFPGPIGGLIVSRDAAIFERVRDVTRRRLDNYQNNRVAAMGVVFAEMLSFGERLSISIVKTAQALAAALTEEGLDVVGKHLGYTQSHMLLLNTTPQGPAAVFRQKMESVGIFTTALDLWPEGGGDITNTNTSLSTRTGLRIGTNDIARLGYSQESIRRLASLLADVLLSRRNDADLRKQVMALAECHPDIADTFKLENVH